MLRFGKSTEYALLGLMHLVHSPTGQASSSEIARAFGLSSALVSKILKCLLQNGLLSSKRGVGGGYRLVVDLSEISLASLMRMLRRADLGDRPVRVAGGHQPDALPTEAVLLALHRKLEGFLGGIALSDLIMPGRRIDVPVEFIGIKRKLQEVAVR